VPGDPRPDPSEAAEETGLGRHLAVFFEDPLLWPILLILVIHAALAGALVLLWALRGASLAGLALLAILLTLSGDAIRRARRRRRVAIGIATLWVLSALTAAVSARLGIL
jgi:hypothetical protein